MILSVESAITWAEQIDEAQTAGDRGIGAGYNISSTVEELGLDDYYKFLGEIKIALAEFGTNTGNKEISSRVNLF